MLHESLRRQNSRCIARKPTNSYEMMETSVFSYPVSTSSSDLLSSSTCENQIHNPGTMTNCSSSSMDSLISKTPKLCENILTFEELDSENDIDVSSCLVVRPYEIEEADSECCSISSDSSPSNTRSELEVKTFGNFTNVILIDSGLGRKSEKVCQWSPRCAKKRTLSVSFGSDMELEESDSTSSHETRRPTRRIRPFIT